VAAVPKKKPSARTRVPFASPAWSQIKPKKLLKAVPSRLIRNRLLLPVSVVVP
jgi:hypothetical protein